MFLGHFAVALAAKKINGKPSLGTLFLAAQWLDLLWPLLLLTGAEQVIIEPGNSASTPLNFIHYPISHSLLSVLGWSLLFGMLYFALKKNKGAAWLIGTLVLSHWVLDWIVHVPDLQLSPFSETRTGLGLWDQKYLTLFIELAMFAAGCVLYLTSTKAKNKKGNIAAWSLIVFLVVIHLMSIFGPPPTAVEPIAIVGLAQWLIIAWGYWIDRNRDSFLLSK